MDNYFSKMPRGIATGAEFVKALPSLMRERDVRKVTSVVRKQLMAYLRQNLRDIDSYTDIVLVDLGYSGTIQHSLRKCFDQEGLQHVGLHGVYLATVDCKFASLQDGDSAIGLIDSSIIAPCVQQSLLRNIGIMEQLCTAPMGSVRNYESGKVLREEDNRPSEQIALCQELQEYCLWFCSNYQKTSDELKVAPFVESNEPRLWATVILLRFLLMPTAAEQALFSQFRHDVNLGSRMMIGMVSRDDIAPLLDVFAFPKACSVSEPPAWLAASLAEVSPMAQYAYLTSGFGFTSGELFADKVLGQVQAKLIKNGVGIALEGEGTVTAFGHIRLRIPVLGKDTGSLLALPLGGMLAEGIVRFVSLQSGADIASALENRMLQSVPLHQLRYLETQQNGVYFRAAGEGAHLIIDVPPSTKPVLIITVTVQPMSASEGQEGAASLAELRQDAEKQVK